MYLNAIEAALAEGRGALLLVPEIALTPAMAGQFFSRFGDRVAILHSAFTDVERTEQWRRIRSGAASVVVGTRSGVFAPVRNLGLIVVDEEHDGSYKQEETPRYNGRDVAIVRAQAAGACVVLGSATPSLESRYNAERGKYTLLELPEPHRGAAHADGGTDRHAAGVSGDAQAGHVFARSCWRRIGARLENGEQTIVLLNRRGFSSFVACRACGERVQCINCSLTLTYHKRDRRLLCHYCGYAEKVPSVCPKCASEHIYFLGLGRSAWKRSCTRRSPPPACGSPKSCLAIGLSSNNPGNPAPIAEAWNGTRWRSVAVPTESRRRLLYGVSCRSATSCLVVGTYLAVAGTGFERPYALTWNGKSLRPTARPPAPKGSAFGSLTGVSCVTTRGCVAVGDS